MERCVWKIFTIGSSRVKRKKILKIRRLLVASSAAASIVVELREVLPDAANGQLG